VSSSPLVLERDVENREREDRRAPRTVRALPVHADVGLTFFTEFLVLGTSLGVLKLAAAHWGAAGFGEFVLARRALGWIQLPALLGMHLALARFVAMAGASGDRSGEARYIRSGARITITSILVMTAVLLIFERPLAFALLGNSLATSTLRALALAIAGLVVHTVVYGALRGKRRTRAANVLQAIVLGVVPLAAIMMPGTTVDQYLTTTGCAMLALGALVGGSILAEERHHVASLSDGAARRALLEYGASRVPGEVALGALFALPVILAAHRGGAVDAGELGLALSLLQLVGALFSPLGQALLPTISARVASGQCSSENGAYHSARRRDARDVGGDRYRGGNAVALEPVLRTTIWSCRAAGARGRARGGSLRSLRPTALRPGRDSL
jgi:O-antigen/teichoic acid export membrane protein